MKMQKFSITPTHPLDEILEYYQDDLPRSRVQRSDELGNSISKYMSASRNLFMDHPREVQAVVVETGDIKHGPAIALLKELHLEPASTWLTMCFGFENPEFFRSIEHNPRCVVGPAELMFYWQKRWSGESEDSMRVQYGETRCPKSILERHVHLRRRITGDMIIGHPCAVEYGVTGGIFMQYGESEYPRVLGIHMF